MKRRRKREEKKSLPSVADDRVMEEESLCKREDKGYWKGKEEEEKR